MDLKEFVNLESLPITLKIKVTTQSQKTEIFWILWEDILKLRVKAIPEKGKANKEIINFFAKSLGISKNNIEIISGLTDELKIIKINKS